jgi:hypothetical protein
MRLSDAEECTFMPAVCSHLPLRKRDILESYKYNWFEEKVETLIPFEKWVKNMGENLKRFPKIYRYGVLKRCAYLI